MCLLLYVSGHGLGHATREIAVLQALPADVPLVVKTLSPAWHWRNELPNRDLVIVPFAADVGTVQHDSLSSNAPATLTAWRERDAANKSAFAGECADALARGCRLVVSDVPSFGISVARTIGVPSVCVANFTWADIYRELAAQEPGLAPVAETLAAEYAGADLLLEAGLALPMGYFPRRESVGIIARTGVDRRDALLAALPAPARGKRVALVYAGDWGLPVPWERLTHFDEWHFVSLGSPAGALPPNWTVVGRDLMAHPDLVASADLVVSKVGYGIAGECLTGGTPLLFCPRTGFAEYPVIAEYLARSGRGVLLFAEAFASADWGEALDAVPERGTLAREIAPGAGRAAARIREMYGAAV